MGDKWMEEVTATLKADRDSGKQYPDQAIYALQNERVRAALTARFDGGAVLADIRGYPYDFFTGLIPLSFEFAGGADPKDRAAILAACEA